MLLYNQQSVVITHELTAGGKLVVKQDNCPMGQVRTTLRNMTNFTIIGRLSTDIMSCFCLVLQALYLWLYLLCVGCYD